VKKNGVAQPLMTSQPGKYGGGVGHGHGGGGATAASTWTVSVGLIVAVGKVVAAVAR
jgi:hypothetical protein